MKKARLSAFALLVLGLSLNACAAPPAPVVVQAPAATGSVVTGVVAGVRTAASGSQGVNAVLAALSEPIPAQQIQRAEVVIVKTDGNAVSSVQPVPAQNLQPGDHVAIIQGASTNLVRQN